MNRNDVYSIDALAGEVVLLTGASRGIGRAIGDQLARIRDALARQAAGPVRWSQITARMAAEGVTHIVECGPGKVLGGLTKRIAPSVESLSISDMTSLRETLAKLNG